MKYRVIMIIFRENMLFQTFLDDILAHFIGVGFIKEYVELEPEIFICFGKSVVYPGVHGFPEF